MDIDLAPRQTNTGVDDGTTLVVLDDVVGNAAKHLFVEFQDNDIDTQ